MGLVNEAGSDGVDPKPGVVLVVKDEVLVRMLACDILTEAGYHPLEAVNADEALTIVEARQDIAVVFTDVDMPGEINGLGLARLIALRAPHLPILITSGAAVVAPTDLPARGRFLQKPYSPSTLVEAVTDLVRV